MDRTAYHITLGTLAGAPANHRSRDWETSHIKLGTGVEVLYQSHPVRLATELAQLDHMAQGRLLFGFGGGGAPTDAQLYGVDFASGQHQEMSREALDIILSCWQEDGPSDYAGKYWSVNAPAYNDRYYWHVNPTLHRNLE